MFTFLAFVPESPRWLLKQDRTEDGLEAIRRYFGKGLSVDDSIVQSEYQSIKGALMIEKEANISFATVLARRDRSGHLKRLLLGCGGQFMQVSHKQQNATAITCVELTVCVAIRRDQRVELLLHHHFNEECWPG